MMNRVEVNADELDEPRQRQGLNAVEDEIARNLVDGLQGHAVYFSAVACLCTIAYFQPYEGSTDAAREDCFEAYHLFLLINGICLVPPVLLIIYIVS